MIVVRVELVSAVTGKTTELARMEIINKNDSQTQRRGNYVARTLTGRSTAALNRRATQRMAEIENWPRLTLHVWNLVATSLRKMGYGNP